MMRQPNNLLLYIEGYMILRYNQYGHSKNEKCCRTREIYFLSVADEVAPSVSFIYFLMDIF